MSPISPKTIDQATRASLIQMMGEQTFGIFISRLNAEISDLLIEARDLIDAQRFEDAALAAHKVAGSAAVLGAEGLRQTIIRFEMAARDGYVEECLSALNTIEQNTPEIMSALSSGQ